MYVIIDRCSDMQRASVQRACLLDSTRSGCLCEFYTLMEVRVERCNMDSDKVESAIILNRAYPDD